MPRLTHRSIQCVADSLSAETFTVGDFEVTAYCIEDAKDAVRDYKADAHRISSEDQMLPFEV
jgi:hypothetical protein